MMFPKNESSGPSHEPEIRDDGFAELVGPFYLYRRKKGTGSHPTRSFSEFVSDIDIKDSCRIIISAPAPRSLFAASQATITAVEVERRLRGGQRNTTKRSWRPMHNKLRLQGPSVFYPCGSFDDGSKQPPYTKRRWQAEPCKERDVRSRCLEASALVAVSGHLRKQRTDLLRIPG